MLSTFLLLAVSAPGFELVAEKSGLTRTGRYDEAVAACERLQADHPKQARCAPFGHTPEGRPMMALVVGSDPKVLDPLGARAAGRLVVLAQGGIHAGEIDGKDAGLILFRDLLEGREPNPPWGQVTVVFVPVFNVDGHERFGPNQRPNQVGPEESGFRTTSQNYNLNRDYTKADSPEMRAMLGLLQAWQPELYIDLHVTDGAEFQHDVSVMIEPSFGASRTSTRARTAQELQARVLGRLKQAGHLPLDFYPAFEEDDDPTSGFALGSAPARFGTGYWAARGGLGVLVETHSWKPYAARVKATMDVLRAFLAEAAAGRAKLQAVLAEDARRGVAGQAVTLSWGATESARPYPFLGYKYTRTPSPISGGLKTTYDPRTPETWNVPMRDVPVSRVQVQAPKGGYVLLPGARATLEEHLRRHGLKVRVLARSHPAQEVEAFRAEKAEPAKATYEGRVLMSVAGKWAREPQALPAGSLWVPIDQPGARLVLWLLEPTAPDSYAAWGFLNTYFERKEYIEPYVLEPFAEALMARDPVVRAAFVAKLADPKFAQNAEARLAWFHERHPSWDQRLGLYPIFKLDRAPE